MSYVCTRMCLRCIPALPRRLPASYRLTPYPQQSLLPLAPCFVCTPQNRSCRPLLPPPPLKKPESPNIASALTRFVSGILGGGSKSGMGWGEGTAAVFSHSAGAVKRVWCVANASIQSRIGGATTPKCASTELGKRGEWGSRHPATGWLKGSAYLSRWCTENGI